MLLLLLLMLLLLPSLQLLAQAEASEAGNLIECPCLPANLVRTNLLERSERV